MRIRFLCTCRACCDFFFYFYLFKIPTSDLLKDGGFIKSISGFVSNLPGFYIAALAAIATFNREQIDYPLIGTNGTPFIKITRTKENGRIVDTQEKLTRRLFLCMLFSFLTALSICIVIFNAFITPLINILNNDIANWCYIIIFLFLTWQMLVSTFLDYTILVIGFTLINYHNGVYSYYYTADKPHGSLQFLPNCAI